MSLWGASTTDESKPKYLTDEEKRDCYADSTGWTVAAGVMVMQLHKEKH